MKKSSKLKKIMVLAFTCLFALGTFMLMTLSSLASTGIDSKIPFIQGLFEDYLSEPINILVFGTDASSGCTDTMMVVNVNPDTTELSVISIPRDTKVDVDGRSRKINSLYVGKGPHVAMDTVGSMLGIKIKYFIHLDLSVLKKVVDDLGGVDFDVPTRMFYRDNAQKLLIDLQPGMQRLNGAQVEQLLRFRKWGGDKPYPAKPKEHMAYYDGGDLKRIETQQAFMKELINQKLKLSNIGKLGQVLQSIFNYMTTDMKMDDILKPSNSFLSKFSIDQVYTFRLDGQDKMINGASYFLYNKKILNTTIKDMNDRDSQPAKEVVEKYFKCNSWYDGSTGISRANVIIDNSTGESDIKVNNTKPVEDNKNINKPNKNDPNVGKDYFPDNNEDDEEKIKGTEASSQDSNPQGNSSGNENMGTPAPTQKPGSTQEPTKEPDANPKADATPGKPDATPENPESTKAPNTTKNPEPDNPDPANEE